MHATYIAALDLIAVHADGTRAPVGLRVAAPEQVGADEWRCAVRLDGLHDRLVPMHGADGVQALCLALGLAASLLRDFVAHGGRLLDAAERAHAGHEADWPLEAYFGWLGTPRPRAT